MPSGSLCGLYVVRAFVVRVDAFPFGLCHFEEAVARIVAERRELRRVPNGERTFLCRWLVVLNLFDALDANILCVVLSSVSLILKSWTTERKLTPLRERPDRRVPYLCLIEPLPKWRNGRRRGLKILSAP